MKKCLVDASSAILLFKCDLFQALVETYKVIMCDAVFEELTKAEHPGAQEFVTYGAENKVMITQSKFALLDQQSGSASAFLHGGERDTVICFEAGLGNFIITDDGRAARYCLVNRIPYINALLFPRLLYFSDELSETEYIRAMTMLINIGRYSPAIIDFARCCSEEELSFFLP